VLSEAAASGPNPAAVFLLPFMIVQIAAMISSAGSGGFEWLYPLRFFAGAAALFYFRAEYLRLNWRVSWFSPLVGALVFAVWIAVDRLRGGGDDSAFREGLIGMPITTRYLWIGIRIAAATITVPIAEELAFRGYGLRRLVSVDFESVAFQRVTLFSIFASSLIFGAMHGKQWLEGALAGAVYASVLLWRGRMGDAVVAHATTNTLLAFWVITRGAWHLW
jgi:CAAX prenyl protease-like protein